MIYICDFDDSFTYNIYSELSLLTDTPIKVIEKSKIASAFHNLKNVQDRTIILLGPGPGRPEQYQFLHEHLHELYANPNIFLMGVCLGHQIIWHCLLGLKIKHSAHPIHGQQVCYELNQNQQEAFSLPEEITVQKYNSLAVEVPNNLLEHQLPIAKLHMFLDQDELVMGKTDNLLTYQFHPESIGTTCPKAFFRPALEFLIQ